MNWLDIICKNERKILESGRCAYEKAMRNLGSRFYVRIDCNGDVYISEDIVGGNLYKVFEFCFRDLEINISDDDIRNRMIEKYSSELKELERLAKENESGIEVEMINSYNPIFLSIIEECRNDEMNFLISECMYCLTDRLDYLKECLYYEYNKEKYLI